MRSPLTPEQPGTRLGAADKRQNEAPAQDGLSASGQLNAWIASHKASFTDSALRIVRQPFGSFFTCLVIAVALSLPMGLNLLLGNLDRLGASWQQAARISVFLQLSTSAQQAQKLMTDLQAQSGIATVELISREQALQDFSARYMPHQPGKKSSFLKKTQMPERNSSFPVPDNVTSLTQETSLNFSNITVMRQILSSLHSPLFQTMILLVFLNYTE